MGGFEELPVASPNKSVRVVVHRGIRNLRISTNTDLGLHPSFRSLCELSGDVGITDSGSKCSSPRQSGVPLEASVNLNRTPT